MPSLFLQVNPQGWRHFISRKNDPAFLKLAKKVWARDQFECQYCGIVMQAHQEVINIDSTYTNNALSNLATACSLCAQCGFLESIGPSIYGGGTLIYLPEISQARLNGFCYPVFEAIQNETSEETVANKIYRSLSIRAQLVEKYLGEGMSDPMVLGQLLVESDLSCDCSAFISDLRLLPMQAAFKNQVRQSVYEHSAA